MRIPRRLQTLGIVGGIALFIAVGLFITVAANRPQPSHYGSGAIPEAVTAPADQLGRAFAAVAARVKPAVVSVYSEKTVRVQAPDFGFPFGDDFFNQFFGNQGHPRSAPPREYKVPQHGMGTGMLLDRAGHVLTNYHVVQDVDEIRVQLADKRSFKAKIIGSDPKTDVAVLEMNGSLPNDLATVTLGDSDALEVGHLVLAIGAPFGLTQTVTTGIISAKGRSDVGIADYEDFLQTDAAINPGNSGGPLIDMRGEVIGMNSAIETNVGQYSGVGFAIPVNMIKAMLPTLTKGKTITRGMLGISIQDVTKELAEQFNLPGDKGALVSQISKGSPAEKAGMKVGDVIVRFNGKEVADSGQLRNLVAAAAPGSSAELGVIRAGKEISLTVTVGKMTPEAMAASKPTNRGGENMLSRLGLGVQTMTPDLAEQYGLEGGKGVLITDVEEGSPAAMAGLQQGDLIVEADRKAVGSVAELQAILGRDREQVLLLVRRENGSNLYVVLRLR